MHRLFTSALACLIVISIHSQENEINNPSQYFQPELPNIPIWSNDCSACSDWIFDNGSDIFGSPWYEIDINFECSNYGPAGPYNQWADGVGDGSSAPIMNSTTSSNGIIIVDSDLFGAGADYDAAWVENCWVQTADPIDCSAAPFVSISIETRYRCWDNGASDDSEKCLIEISRDGTSWPDISTFSIEEGTVDYGDGPVQSRWEVFEGYGTSDQSDNPSIKEFDITAAAGGQSTVFVRFRWSGTWGYSWEIDDIQLYQTFANDTRIDNYASYTNYGQTYVYEYGAWPQSQIPSNLEAGAKVYNAGYEAQTGVHIELDHNGTVDMSSSIDLEYQAQDTLTVPYQPTGLGDVEITYNLLADAEDENPSNNTITQGFEITEYSWGRDDGFITGAFPGDGTDDFIAVVGYNVVADATIYSIDVALINGYDEGTPVIAYLYDVTDPDFLSDSNPADGGLLAYSNEVDLTGVPGNEEGAAVVTWYTLTLDEPYEALAGDLLAAGFQSYGGANLQIGEAQYTYDNTAFVYGPFGSGSAYNWYYTNEVPMVRINLDPNISGCTIAVACNYNPLAIVDDGSCTYPGCNDLNACNYDELAGCNDNSCTYPGCTDSTSINYDANAGCDDGSCISSFGSLDIIAPVSIYYSDTLEVNLMITGGQDLYGAYASLQYDTSLLLLIGDNLGTYFGDDVLTSPAQDNNGIVEFGATNMGPVSGANGDGLFYTLRFIPVGPIEPSNSETFISIINNEAYTSEGLPGGLFYPEASIIEIIYEAEVWPGDLNHDYEVNVSDILPIGYFYGETGPERPDATLQWESQPCPLWDVGMDFPGDGFYKVFADGNGDGEIQLSDQIAVGININQVVVGMAPFEDELNMMVMGGGDITPVVISSAFNPNTIDIDVDNEVTFVVSATTDMSNQNLFHGISVSMDLSEILNDANNVSVDYSNSGMGELNSSMIALDYPEDSQLDVAITRTNNDYLLGEFELFSITLPLIDLPSGQYQIPIIVNESNNSEGASVLTTVIPSTLIINSSNSIDEQSNCNINVYPNPASNNLTVDLGDLNGVNTIIKLYDSSSKLVFEKQSSSTLLIDVSGYAKGLYTLELSTTDKVLRSQVVIE